jgi:imidazole glycerol-phosphate synthase subunit HisH
MPTVAIVDYGIGNLRSVQRAVEKSAALAGVACSATISDDPDVIWRADHVVVPGQGAFRDCAAALGRGLGEVVIGHIRSGKPFLGICMGLQMLFETSDEAPGCRGLGVFSGRIVRLEDGRRDPITGEVVKIPHMGWNQIALEAKGHAFLDAAGGSGTHLYFVHSYNAVPADPSIVVATAEHGPFRITAAVARENVFACQFHPEKSQAAGLGLLSAFVRS